MTCKQGEEYTGCEKNDKVTITFPSVSAYCRFCGLSLQCVEIYCCGVNKLDQLNIVIFLQSGGMNLARIGPWPTVVVAIVFGIVFLIFAAIVVSTNVSERRLKLFSIIFWVFLVLQQYASYAVLVHHTPTTSVSRLFSLLLADLIHFAD